MAATRNVGLRWSRGIRERCASRAPRLPWLRGGGLRLGGSVRTACSRCCEHGCRRSSRRRRVCRGICLGVVASRGRTRPERGGGRRRTGTEGAVDCAGGAGDFTGGAGPNSDDAVGEAAPSGCDVRDDDAGDVFEVGDDGAVFDVVEDADDVRHGGLRGVEDLRWEGGGDVDEVVEGADELWGEILDEVGGLTLL